MASMSSSVMEDRLSSFFLMPSSNFFPVGHGFPVVTVQEKGGDRAGERPHEADSGNHQKNREKLARRGDRVGVSVAHGGGRDEGPPNAVGQAHALRQMDAHGPQQDNGQRGNADVLESVRIEKTPDARGEPQGVGKQVQVPGEPQDLFQPGEAEQPEEGVERDDGQQVPDVAFHKEPFGGAEEKADDVVQDEYPVNDPVHGNFPLRGPGGQVDGGQRDGHQGQQAHDRFIRQFQEQEVPGCFCVWSHGGKGSKKPLPDGGKRLEGMNLRLIYLIL